MGEWDRPQRREPCFGIQPTYHSYCRASGNSHIPVNTCGFTRARALGHQPSQILSHTEQYHHPTQQLLAEREEVMYIDFSFVSCWLCRQKRTKPLPAAKPRANNHILLNMIQLHSVSQIFIRHFCFSTATIVSHPVVNVAKWHSCYYHSNIPLKWLVHYM